jgi:hypothetical protein
MQHGFDNLTGIVGMKGVLKINLIDTADKDGIHNDETRDCHRRYERGPVNELSFAASLQNSQSLPYQLPSAVKSMEIARALQKSLVTSDKISFPKQ